MSPHPSPQSPTAVAQSSLCPGATVFFLPENFLSSRQVKLLDFYDAGRTCLNELMAETLGLTLKDGLVQVLREEGGRDEGSRLVQELAQAVFGDPAALRPKKLEALDLTYAPSEQRAGRSFQGAVMDVQTVSFARSGYVMRSVLVWDDGADSLHRHRLPRICAAPRLGQSISVHYGPRGKPFVQSEPCRSGLIEEWQAQPQSSPGQAHG